MRASFYNAISENLSPEELFVRRLHQIDRGEQVRLGHLYKLVRDGYAWPTIFGGAKLTKKGRAKLAELILKGADR